MYVIRYTFYFLAFKVNFSCNEQSLIFRVNNWSEEVVHNVCVCVCVCVCVYIYIYIYIYATDTM